MVDLAFEEKFAAPVTLAELRDVPALRDMLVLRKGQRLSIQPVTGPEFSTVKKLGRAKA